MKVYKTTLELSEDLKEPVMIHILRNKIKDHKYSLKQFLNDAVREKLDREKEIKP